jgi:hypothetical protein
VNSVGYPGDEVPCDRRRDRIGDVGRGWVRSGRSQRPFGNTPSGSTDVTTSPGRSGEQATTPEQTTSVHRIPVEKEEYRGGACWSAAKTAPRVPYSTTR